MKKINKLLCLFLAVIIFFGMSVTGKAALSIDSGIRIEIITDKESYKTADIAEITVIITNASDRDKNNIEARVILENMEPVGKKTSELTKTVDVLKAGESFSFKYKATLFYNYCKLNFIQKIMIIINRFMNGGYSIYDQGFHNVVADKVERIQFGDFEGRNVVTVGYYYGFDKQKKDEIIIETEEVEMDISQLTDSNIYEGASTDKKILLMENMLSKLKENESITNYTFNENLNLFSFEYSNGIKSGVFVNYSHSHEDMSFMQINSSLTNSFAAQSDAYLSTRKTNESVSMMFLSTLSPATEEKDFNPTLSLIQLRNRYIDLGCYVQHEPLATVSTFQNLEGYDFIYIQSHGEFDEDGNGISLITTNELATDKKKTAYWDLYSKNAIRAYSFDGVVKFVICPTFFEENYKNNELENSIVFIGSCEAFGKNNIENKEFYNSLEKAGAATVIGFCNSVNKWYSSSFGEKMLHFLSQGNTVGESYVKTVEILGENANVFLNSINGKGRDEYPAYPLIFGDKSIKLFKKEVEHLGSFSADVRNAINDKTLGNVSVLVGHSADGAGLLSAFKTAEDGVFTVQLPEGKYNCFLNKKGFEGKIVEIQIEEGQNIVWLDPIYMEPKYSVVTGTVTDSKTGKAISGVSVEALDDESEGFEPFAVTTTDQNGKYTLKLPYGDYSLSFNHDDYEYYGTSLSVCFEAYEIDAALLPKDNDEASGDENTTPVIASGNCGANGDNVKWALHEDGELVISGSGKMKDYGSLMKTPWYSSRNSIIKASINYGVTNIGASTFSWCSELTGVTIGKSVTSIGVCAFEGCGRLTNITIPDSVTFIDDSAFLSCTVTSFTVDKNNDYYSSDEYGVLFDKDKTIIVRYPAGNSRAEYVIPNSVIGICDYAFIWGENLTHVTVGNRVTSIGHSAFNSCHNLTSLTIPAGVICIDSKTFFNCISLTSIIIPDSVKSIGDGAFYCCSSLKNVYYTGSQENWKRISIDSSNEDLTNATIHYNS